MEEHSSKQDCEKVATSNKQIVENMNKHAMKYSSKQDGRTQHQKGGGTQQQTRRWNTTANKMMEHSGKHDVGTQQQT